MSDLVQELYAAVLGGQPQEAAALVRQKLDSGVPAGTLLKEGVTAALSAAGGLFERGEITAAQLLRGAEAAERCMEILRPHLFK